MPSSNKNGFTLVELTVSMAVMLIILSVLFNSKGNYNERLTLNSNAYNVALAIRQAQVESLGVKATGGNFNTSYGVLLSFCPPPNKSMYRTFTDTNLDGQYQTTEPTVTTNYVNNYEVTRVSGTSGGSTVSSPNNCAGSFNVPTSIAAVSITFLRPNPSAKVTFYSMNATPSGSYVPIFTATAPISVQIGKTGSGSLISTITIDATGNISVQ